jgi:hypothetical protein
VTGASAGHSQLGTCFKYEEQHDERNENAWIYCRSFDAEQQCAFAVRGWTVLGLVWLLRMVLLLCPVLVQQLLLVVLGALTTAYGILNPSTPLRAGCGAQSIF